MKSEEFKDPNASLIIGIIAFLLGGAFLTMAFAVFDSMNHDVKIDKKPKNKLSIIYFDRAYYAGSSIRLTGTGLNGFDVYSVPNDRGLRKHRIKSGENRLECGFYMVERRFYSEARKICDLYLREIAYSEYSCGKGGKMCPATEIK